MGHTLKHSDEGRFHMKVPAEQAARNLAAVREKKPLIHNITNMVAASYTANALLAMGASPVMAHAVSEVEEMTTGADALVLNVGTVSEDLLSSMVRAGRRATSLGKPMILDPVGVGATTYRGHVVRTLLETLEIRVIRGNPSEILSLTDTVSRTRGVDSIHSVADALEAAKALAGKLAATIAVSGPVDVVTDGNRVLRVANGHPLMSRVTGCGCAATAVIAAFAAVDTDPVSAAATALAYFGLAGESAGKAATAPGSFMIELLNALYTISPEMMAEGCKIDPEGTL